jgi:hypothetical protein
MSDPPATTSTVSSTDTTWERCSSSPIAVAAPP